jgi:hypothetical protein
MFTVDGADDSGVYHVERALDDGNVSVWLTYNWYIGDSYGEETWWEKKENCLKQEGGERSGVVCGDGTASVAYGFAW